MAAAAAAEGEEEAPLEPVLPLEAENVAERKELFDSIVGPDLDPDKVKKASRDERQVAGQMDQTSLTYSEMDFDTVLKLLDKLRADFGPLYAGKGTFLDLGSGAGKVCLAAALLHPFEKVVGIEVVHCLNEFAGGMKARYAEATFPEGMAKPELEFIKGDFVGEFQSKVEPLAAQVAVCLAAATCYDINQLQAMGKLAEAMPEGALFITLTQMLPKTILNHPQPEELLAPDSVGWVMVHSEPLEMLWGNCTCFVFKKVPPGTSGAPKQPAAEEPAAPEGGAEETAAEAPAAEN